MPGRYRRVNIAKEDGKKERKTTHTGTGTLTGYWLLNHTVVRSWLILVDHLQNGNVSDLTRDGIMYFR